MIIYLTPTISLYSWENSGAEKATCRGSQLELEAEPGLEPDLLIPSVPCHSMGAPFLPPPCLLGLGFCHLGPKTLISMEYINLGGRRAGGFYSPEVRTGWRER